MPEQKLQLVMFRRFADHAKELLSLVLLVLEILKLILDLL